MRNVWCDDSGRVHFSVWAFGFPGTDRARGYLWSREALPNDFPCLDARCFPPGFMRRRFEPVHVRIDPTWALFAF